MKTKINLIMLLFVMYFNANAQAPNGFNYQAVVRNSSGQPILNQTVSIRFTIHESTPTGSVIFQETQSKTTNSLGLFSTIVGTGTLVSGAYPSVAQLAIGVKYFQVEIDPTGSTNYLDMGTTQIVSVMYSNYANNAGNATNLSSSATINPNQITNAGADKNQVLKYDGSNWIPANDLGDDWGTQVVKTDVTLSGDGTGSTPLGIAQNGAAKGDVLKWNLTGGWVPAADDNNIYTGGTGITIGSGNVINSNWTSGSNGIYNNNSNGVGIGTSSPNTASKLHVFGVGSINNNLAPVYQAGVYIDSASSSQSYSGLYAEGGWRGVFGHNKGSRNGVQAIGVFGLSEGAKYTIGYGVLGNGFGTGPNNYGVYGQAANGTSNNIGVYGVSTSSSSSLRIGVYGAGYSTGMYGTSNGVGYSFVSQLSGLTPGIVGQVRTVVSNRPVGVLAHVANKTAFGQTGLLAYADSNSNNYGLEAYTGHSTSSGYGVYAASSGSGTNYAGYFSGLLYATNASSSIKAFKIDHPLDPTNKYLYHSSIESPDMMNIYNGNIITDMNGEATITLPAYFNALNKDFKYQLTCIGQFAQAIVLEEIGVTNQFKIKTDKPNVKVSWQVSGIRNDAVANLYRIQAEVEKPNSEKGFYLTPEAYGFGPEKNAAWYNSSQNKNRVIITTPATTPVEPVQLIPLKN